MVDQPFDPKKLFRSPFFWVAAASALFLVYAGLIGFTVLSPKSPEVNAESANARIREGEMSNSTGNASPDRPVQTDGGLSKARVDLVTNGGWLDTDNREMTIVLRFSGLRPEAVDEIIRTGLTGISIDGIPATIVNSEPYGRNGFLTRAKAVLPDDKFERFQNGETQSVEVSTTLEYRRETKTEVIGKRFAKRDKTEAEGVKIAWK